MHPPDSLLIPITREGRTSPQIRVKPPRGFPRARPLALTAYGALIEPHTPTTGRWLERRQTDA